MPLIIWVMAVLPLVVVIFVVLTAISTSKKVAVLRRTLVGAFAKIKDEIKENPGSYLSKWNQEFTPRIKENGGPKVAIQTQSAYMYLLLHPLPEFRAMGRRGEQGISLLSGEELRLFGKGKLGLSLRDAVNNVEKAFSTKSLSQMYKTLGDYSFIVSYRRQLEFARRPEKNELLERNLGKFKECLERCIQHLELNHAGKARQEVRSWWKQWRYDKDKQNDEYILPPQYLPLARCVVESIFDIYGDTVEWTKRRHHIEDNRLFAELTKKSLAAMNARDYTRSMRILGEFEEVLPQPFESALIQ